MKIKNSLIYILISELLESEQIQEFKNKYKTTKKQDKVINKFINKIESE